MTEWKDIESAPKDGGEFEAWDPNGREWRRVRRYGERLPNSVVSAREGKWWTAAYWRPLINPEVSGVTIIMTDADIAVACAAWASITLALTVGAFVIGRMLGYAKGERDEHERWASR